MSGLLKKVGLSLVVAALFIPVVHAEQGGKKLAEKFPKEIVISASVNGCDDDVKKHCDGLGDNTQKIFMCLAAYEDHLSDSCKRGIVEAAVAMRLGAAAIEYSLQACEADADKHCLDVEPGEGRLVMCIKENEAKVSSECVTALKETGFWDSVK